MLSTPNPTCAVLVSIEPGVAPPEGAHRFLAGSEAGAGLGLGGSG